MNKFSMVQDDELDLIKKQLGENQGSNKSRGNLTGIAFSGGGIRSATFNLGVIQALARHGLLDKFDYLSTVSGGGYIGSWLSAQLHRSVGNNSRDKISHFQNAIKSSKQSGREPESISWLRSYSNYLTPKKGVSGDTLAAIGTWLRNTLLNQVTLGLFFALLILLPQVVLLMMDCLGWFDTRHSMHWLLLGIAFVFCAILLCAKYLPQMRCCADSKCAESLKQKMRQPTALIILVATLGAYSLSVWIYSSSLLPNSWMNGGQDNDVIKIDASIKILKDLAGLAFIDTDTAIVFSPMLTAIESLSAPAFIAAMWAVIYTMPWIAAVILSLMKPDIKRCVQCPHTQDADMSNTTRVAAPSQFQIAFFTIIFAMAAGAFGGWLINLLTHTVARQSADIRLWWATGFGTPLLLMIFCLILVLHQGLMARLFRISQLEWWARMGGYVLLIATTWAGIHVLMIYAPPFLDKLEAQFIAAGGLAWAAHSLAGVLLGKSASTSGQGHSQWKELITRAAPYVFVLGYLVAISWGVHALMLLFGKHDATYLIQPVNNDTFKMFLNRAIEINNNADFAALGIVLASGTAVFLIMAWRLDVNLFSIHHFYRNRLVRCYLGAGRGKDRVPNAFTGFDPCDDIKMSDLKQRPLHLINTAINLVHGDNLAWQDRKAFSFTFSPVACGFEYPPNAGKPGGGYFGTEQYMNGVRLGTAMAASGAAASPNMGYHSSPAVSFLLTVFNVRLGHWCPNTEVHALKQNAIKRESPPIGGEYLLKELFGQTDDKNAFVYLSDGGHFENLGVYELVRRHCRYIMVVDAVEDKDRTFGDAANMIRKCFIDFGVTIDINFGAMRNNKEGNCQSCYALGDIIYPTSPEAESAKVAGNWGVLLYIKPSLLEKMPEDIRQYAETNGDFPHQTTADQFFDEAQFESYRHLGNDLMDKVISSIGHGRTPSDKTWKWLDA